jgi:histidyl-tRNA synthetase
MATPQGALPGFRDFFPEQFAERAYVSRVWRDVARRFAFVEYDGPPLEPLDLYTKKSGEEIVGQLYNFTDKGGREISLRPEMTPTLARMAAARANTLRKPVRWFSMPQLFRYERKQRGRLREHFQLNVDIIGESSVAADAELLAVAIEIMRELGLGPDDVRARVSDRRLLHALLTALGAQEAQLPAIFAVVDKIERQPREISVEKLGEAGLAAAAVESVLALMENLGDDPLGKIESLYGAHAGVAERIAEFRTYFDSLAALGVSDWVTLDLRIVRGLAYYTGIVFELFDAKGELRAICGGGRYDTLLANLGGVDLPALGFGMGDVVITELLRERGMLQDRISVAQPDFWIAAPDAAEGEPLSGRAGHFAVAAVATALRRAGASVEYALREQSLSKQKKASRAAGATYFVTLAPDFPTSHVVSVDPFAETAMPTLGELVGQPPLTVERLVTTLRESPQVLSSNL